MGGDDCFLCTQHAGERFEIIQENENGLDEAVRMTYELRINGVCVLFVR
jgi:hypothetical protein